MNYRINFVLHGELSQVICFRNDLAKQIIQDLASKGATAIEVIGKGYNDDMELVEKFRAFIDEKDGTLSL